MLHTLPVAGVAAQTFGEMRMRLKIRHLLGMAWHPFQVKTLDANDAIMAPLPPRWMHATDELYDSLRGPAKNMKLLATAYSDPATGGTGENEPMLFTITFGKGRIFHTTLGHDVEAMRCTGFIATLQRGTEWAAHGKVTQKVPKDFPSSDAISLRQ